nr:MAG TPA: Major capsid protein [Microviridae sp.]
MAKNVFDQIGDIRNDIKRNNFDWSKTVNFTTALGRITPVYCELCPPNSSLKIKPQFGLRFMPMMFPVQTNMKAYLSFYKVPLRTLWKDFRDWVSSPNDQSSKLEPPYISLKDSAFGDGALFGVSGLADYLGIPVTSVQGEVTGSIDGDTDPKLRVPSTVFKTWGTSGAFGTSAVTGHVIKSLATLSYDDANYYFQPFTAMDSQVSVPNQIAGKDYIAPIRVVYSMGASYCDSFRRVIQQCNSSVGSIPNLFGNGAIFACAVKTTGTPGQSVSLYKPVRARIENVTPVSSSLLHGDGIEITFDVPFNDVYNKIFLFYANCSELLNSNGTSYGEKLFRYGNSRSIVSLEKASCPYYLDSPGDADNTKRIKLSAYPFRAYDAVYNAYMRNIKNNPFKINGEVKYNQWITSDAGGKDTVDYHLHYANWASDMFTTAVPSPQQGQAPLVGITTYSKQVVMENGHVETQLGTALVDEDGKKYDVTFESNGEELKDVRYRQLDQSTPVQPVNSLYDLVTSGISINDFRNVNAYQRYLELNQMRGYSYKEIIDGRFDVNVKYCDLLMPEYLGGCTRDIQMNAITQTVETSDSGTYQGALGSQAGNATLFSGSEDISVFCDEESIVIGVMSVVPMPVYTQTLPKFFLYRDRLDSFSPEFDHIGFQPIKQSEISPVLSWQENRSNLDKVFGYQRPWYEYVQKLDTASGLFRTQLRNFLINRVFITAPLLNSAFTTVDPEEVNDVFSVTETTDKILGQVYFDVVAKLPISRVCVPKLE